VKRNTESTPNAERNADDHGEHETGNDGALDGVERMHMNLSPALIIGCFCGVPKCG
jgi:hypothetical protein